MGADQGCRGIRGPRGWGRAVPESQLGQVPLIQSHGVGASCLLQAAHPQSDGPVWKWTAMKGYGQSYWHICRKSLFDAPSWQGNSAEKETNKGAQDPQEVRLLPAPCWPCVSDIAE